jgi:hypothetical protein
MQNATVVHTRQAVERIWTERGTSADLNWISGNAVSPPGIANVGRFFPPSPESPTSLCISKYINTTKPHAVIIPEGLSLGHNFAINWNMHWSRSCNISLPKSGRDELVWVSKSSRDIQSRRAHLLLHTQWCGLLDRMIGTWSGLCSREPPRKRPMAELHLMYY